MLRFGPQTGPVVVVAMPLFEEANRMRAFAVTLCRALAKRGVASVLPDLPGQGESLVPLASFSAVGDIGEGYEGAALAIRAEGRAPYGVAIRSGALLDFMAELDGRWHFAPQPGPDLLRDLTRIKQLAVGTAEPLHEVWWREPLAANGLDQPPVEVAGNVISPNFLTILKADVIWEAQDGENFRTVRLDTDLKPADRHIPGTPLWRRAEPGNDPALAALLADDIAAWIATCEG